MTSVLRAALAAAFVLGASGAALAEAQGNNSGSGLNPNTTFTGNDRSAGVESGNYDRFLDPSRAYGRRAYGPPGYYAPAYGRPVYRRGPYGVPFEGYPY